MAENSIMWTTDGTGDGIAGGYNMAMVVYNWLRTTFIGDDESEGVLRAVEGELEVTDGGGTDVDIATGAAYCYGYYYYNTAQITETLPTPTALDQISRIVLRASWAPAQTVRVAVLTAPEGDPAPTLTQSEGTTWEIPLAQVTVGSAGDITEIIDQREWLHPNIGVNSAMIDPGAVLNASLRDSAAQSVLGRHQDTAGVPGDIQATVNDRLLARVANELGWVQLALGMIPDGLITGAKLNTNTVALSNLVTAERASVETANTLALRDAAGRFRAVDPVHAQDVATRSFVEDSIIPEGGPISPGMIVMWSGAIGDIPAGYVLCDGNNGTPDLRGRFIAGAGGAYGVNDNGGNNTVDISHTHGRGTLGTGSAGGHNHGGATGNSTTSTLENTTDGGVHGHPADAMTADLPGTEHTVINMLYESAAHNHLYGVIVHDHPISTQAAHTHTVSGSTATGGGTSVENRPPFWALAFIMKT